MDAYRVIRHPADEDEGARWACRARQQRGPVEIASGPTPAALRLGRTWLSASTGRGIFLFLPWLARVASLTGVRPRMGVPGERSTGDFAIFPPHQKKKKGKKNALLLFEIQCAPLNKFLIIIFYKKQ